MGIAYLLQPVPVGFMQGAPISGADTKINELILGLQKTITNRQNHKYGI